MTVTITRWWWIRHAPVDHPVGRIYGANDVPAITSDEPTFRALAKRLPEGAMWVTTHLTRTRQTAEALKAAGAEIGVPLIEDAFGEQSFGAWQGQSYDDIQRDVGTHRFWLAPAHHRPPEGESFIDLIARVVPAIDRLTEQYRGRDIVAVAHGGTIRAALAHALSVEPEAALRISTANLSLTRLDHIHEPDGRHAWRVAWLNLQPGP